MNTKAEQVGRQGTSAGDYAKYVAALLVFAAGIAAFYLLPWPAPVRGLLVAAALAGAVAVMALTALGRQGREFLSESLFELRKVVWPTQQEARRITLVVMIVVLAVSLILASMDWIISIAVKWLLGN